MSPRTVSPLVVLLIFIGLLGPVCENVNNVSDSAVSHHTASSDQSVNDRNQSNNSALEYWPVATRTDVKIFRKGSLVISRQYWYPFLEIVIKKPISPAITSATTPSYTTQLFSSVSSPTSSMLPTSSFPATAHTTTLGPSTTKTTKSTISIEPLTTIIQAHTSKQTTTSRQISETTESQISKLPTTITNPTTTILPTAYSRQSTSFTSSTRSVLPETTTSNNIPLDTSRQLTAITSELSVFPETITPSTTPATTSIPLTANPSANLPATSEAGVSVESFKTTIAERTTRTAEPELASTTALWSTVAPGTTKAATTVLLPKTGLTKYFMTIHFCSKVWGCKIFFFF
ncbi:uncharacterized protein muc13a isoform X12 [Ctenopharyngodon idella]|uniref:uncharacterized protein muc13a isoform X12 n=1 Tax=Ctenopharyngodon idella TaxID=7959 RepID=UPI002230B5C6|nr:uncharacterized protein muc13a isoform X12 [Ctenopharyngodon idella]